MAAAPTVAVAQPRPPASAWDSRGWVPLGERTVNGRYDHDRIEVGRYEGRYARLTMVVENSDLELIDFRIVFGDRTEYHPRLSHYFREGQRTQVIELPPGESVIRFIDFQYRNLAGGGDARVQVWGFRTDGAPPPPPPPSSNHPSYLHALSDLRMARAFLERPSNIEIRWDENRAIREVDAAIREIKEAAIDDGKDLNDHPAVDRPTWGGRLQRAAEMVAQARNDVSQEEDSPSGRVRHLRQRSLEHIANAERAIREGIEAARAIHEDAPPPPPPAFVWDQRGWTMLGEKRVDSRREDVDRIEVSRWEPRFRQLSLVVLDADMELIDLSVKLKHGEPFHPDVRQFFREGSRARVIDLPGDERTIRWIEFRYRNLPGQGRARVQVWAK